MSRRIVSTRVVRLPNGEVMAALPEPPAFSRDWPELAWLMAYGGKFMVGPAQGHPVTAVAYQQRGAVGSVVLRANESLPELLARLDQAVARLESDDGAEPTNEAGVRLIRFVRRPRP